MHEIKVKILHPAGLKLALKQRSDLLLLLKKVGGQLVGQDIGSPGIPADQAVPEGCFTFPSKVSVAVSK